MEIRSWLTENIAIPLGSPRLNKTCGGNTFFYFFGPHVAGKTLAIRALATETDAMVVGISPTTLGDRFDDKVARLKMLYMAFTCAKNYQPAIINIDDCEMIFKGKKKKK